MRGGLLVKRAASSQEKKSALSPTLDSLSRLLLCCCHSEAETTLGNHKAGDELDPQLRNDLAQLHGNANKLLATRIDAILTGARSATLNAESPAATPQTTSPQSRRVSFFLIISCVCRRARLWPRRC